MDLALHIGSFKVETKGDVWLEVGRWTLYYRRECSLMAAGWKYFAAWRSADSDLDTGWTVLFLKCQLMIGKAKQRSDNAAWRR